ncbi:MAG: cation-efflux pump [Anaerolineae bacterium]|jgi:cation diffusion facilitator family transporter
MTVDVDAHAEKEKRDAALSSVVAAVFLTALKLIVGLMTGSLGILAEAAHSGLDLVAALVTFFAVRIADRPPDEHYRYGYGKVENLSALIETLLLLITCVWIIYEAIQRLFFRPVEIEASIWAFGVMLISIVVDISRSRILYRAARKHNSQALEADALHFSTDIWSSSVVIVGLGLVWLSGRLGPEWDWLVKGDAVAALVVAAIVVYVSLQLGKRAVVVLLDVAPPGLAEQIAAEAGQVPGVQSLGPVRLRQAGASVFVDLVVNVDRSASLEEAHQVAEAVDQQISRIVPRGDVIVHIDPVRRTEENLAQTVSAIAARLGLRTHDVHAHEVRSRYFVDLHVEVSSDLTLGQAHDQVSRLEVAVRQELPQVRDIHSHIEPLATPVVQEPPLDAEEERRLRTQIEAVVQEVTGLDGYSRLHIRPDAGGYDVALHCLADPDLPVTEAHRLADQVEKLLYVRVPGVKRVLVHVTPEGESNSPAYPEGEA